MGSGQYFEPQPAAASRRAAVALTVADRTVELATDRGTFSPSRVDPGTQVLLRKAPPPPPAGDVLDLGCGYGPIAVALALQSPAAQIWAVDVNERAIGLTAENAAQAGAVNVKVCLPDEVGDDVRFSAIYSNPPIRIGKDALHDLLSRWLSRLAADGRAWLVVQRNLGADSLAVWLETQGWPTRKVASQKGYRVLEISPRR